MEMLLVYNAFFFTLLGFCGLIAFAQWRLSKDPAIIWYIGYLSANFFHYLWQFWKDLSGMGNTSGMLLEVDTLMTYIATCCYLIFSAAIFEVKRTDPVFRYFAWPAYYYLAMLGLNLVLQLTTSYDTWHNVHVIVRIIFFPYLFWLAGYMYRSVRFFYQKLILAGTIIVLIGYINTLIIQSNHTSDFFSVQDFINPLHTVWGTIYLYDIKLAIVFDVICFSWAVALRQKHFFESQHLLENARQQAAPANQPALSPPKDHFMDLLYSFLEENYTNENLNIVQIAHAVYLTPGQTNRKLKQKTGLTTEQFLLDFRLHKAKQQLLLSDIPLAVITEAVGLKDQAHFSQAFKKKYGVSPRAFRRQQENAG